MTTTQWLFIVFYAIFWGSVSSVQGRWKMFHWALISKPPVWHRLILSFIIWNIAPILYFIWIFFILKDTPISLSSQWTLIETGKQVVAGIGPSFAVFGFYRFWISMVEFFPTTFYFKKDELPQEIQDIEPWIEKIPIKTSFGPMNFLFALLYLIVPTILAYCMR